MTKRWLDDNGMEYDGLHMGKPVADRIVDDRAIAFTGWPAALDLLNKGGRVEIEQIYRRLFQDAIKEYLTDCLSHEELRSPVLVFGVADCYDDRQRDSGSELVSRLRSIVTGRGAEFLSADIDASGGPDRCCKFEDLDRHVAPSSIGTTVLVSCLQYVRNPFDAPALLGRILRSDGLVYALTPWNVGPHRSAADLWRISDAGYQTIFGDKFDLLSAGSFSCPGRPGSPLGFRGKMRLKRL